MPRNASAKRLKESAPIIPGASLPPPRLWNAHQRIKTGRTQCLPEWPPKKLEENDKWREVVTPDIVEYIDKAKPSTQDRYEILRNPHKYFSRPRNVPAEFRKQVYLYESRAPNHLLDLIANRHVVPISKLHSIVLLTFRQNTPLLRCLYGSIN